MNINLLINGDSWDFVMQEGELRFISRDEAKRRFPSENGTGFKVDHVDPKTSTIYIVPMQ